MARLTITSRSYAREYKDPHKVFKSKISKPCEIFREYDDVLYHSGEETFPKLEDTVYRYHEVEKIYTPLQNNTFTIPEIEANPEIARKWFVTNEEGLINRIIYCD